MLQYIIPKRISSLRSIRYGFSSILALAVLSMILPTLAHSAHVTVGWDASSSSSVTGYKVYYGLASGSYTFPVGNVSGRTTTSYAIPEDLTASRYVIAASATNGVTESVKSAELVIYSMTASAGTGGTISPSGPLYVGSGTNQTFTITPNSGYRVASVTVDGSSVGAVTSYTFSSVAAAHSISATFVASPTTYTITASAGLNGSISPSPSATVNYGANQTFTITPKTGYRVASVTVDGTALGNPATSYTFSTVTANHSIAATFALNTSYTITSSAGLNGSISPSPSATVNYGANQTFTITPKTGYRVASVTVDGTALSNPATTYTFSNVTANHSIAASFSQVTQPPVADAGPDQTVAEGSIVRLNGSNSRDPGNSPLTYMWTQTGGTQVTLSSQTAAQPTFTAPNVGTVGAALSFQLTVTNQIGSQSSDTCIVNVTWVNAPPTAKAGSTQTVPEGTAVTLDGRNSTDPDDGIASYLWEQVSGPLVTLTSTIPSQALFIAPDVVQTGASLTFRLTVTDKGGLKSTATCVVNVTWVNSPPQADAGPNQSVYEGDVVVLDGFASSDPDDGIKSYLWKQTSGSPVTLTNPTGVQASFTAPYVDAAGATLTSLLTVTDNGGLQSTATCNVYVKQKPGPDLTGSWATLYYNGSSLRGSFTVTNTGDQNAGSFSTAFYISDDGVTLGNLIATRYLGSLSAAQSKTLSIRYFGTGLSGKYIVVVIDANKGITESNEQNNKISAVIH